MENKTDENKDFSLEEEIRNTTIELESGCSNKSIDIEE